MATGITQDSALWKETLVGQQGLPSFLNAWCEILAGDMARRCTAVAAPQQVGQCDARPCPNSLDLMIHVAEERRPTKVIALLLFCDGGSPVVLQKERNHLRWA